MPISKKSILHQKLCPVQKLKMMGAENAGGIQDTGQVRTHQKQRKLSSFLAHELSLHQLSSMGSEGDNYGWENQMRALNMAVAAIPEVSKRKNALAKPT